VQYEGVVEQGSSTEESATLREAFAKETRRGARLAILVWLIWFFVGTIGITLVSLYISFHNHAVYHMPMDAVVVGTIGTLLPAPFYFLAARSKRPLLWSFVSLVVDVLVMTQNKFFLFWRPQLFAHYPFFLAVRLGEIESYLILLAIYVLTLSRRFIVWSCVVILASWLAGLAMTMQTDPGASLYWGPLGPGLGESELRAIMNPQVLILDYLVAQIVLAVAFAAFLAGSIERGRRYVIDSVGARAEGDFLARFFPASIASRIGGNAQDALRPAPRHVVVMFVNSVVANESLLESARRFDRVESVVFAHGGTMDRFTGGPIMATFGALEDDPSAQERALACARELLRGGGDAVILHAGTAICGDVGGTHSRTFSVVGDVVNTARRILDVASLRGSGAVASADFLAGLRGEAALFEDWGDVALRGREEPVRLWRLA
jgi:adenylate cyclase